MKLCINGEERVFDLNNIKNLKKLLDHLQVSSNGVVVEHNKSIVARNTLENVLLHEGDQVEIVHFVGGGSSESEAFSQAPSEPVVKSESVEPEKPKRKKKAVGTATVKKKATGSESTPSRKNGPHNLVIVESPAKAKTINKFLGDDYLVVASFGHVRDLPKSKMGVDLESQDFNPHYIVINKARKTVTGLKKQAKGKTGIFLAPDPDREGEAISWHLSHIFKEENGDAAIHRVVFNEITKDAVKQAFNHPRDIDMNLVNAQQARRILDRVVGYELSPLLWRKVGRGLSAGRVQSVALRLIVDREREIKKFVPQEYWSLVAKLSSEKEQNKGKIFLSKLDKVGEEKADLKDKDQTEKIRKALETAQFKVAKIDKKERTRRPQAPFTTSKLQQEAYNKLGFPAAKTMRIAQKLYEGVELGSEGSVGLITYMRTDSVNISASAQKEAEELISRKFGAKFLPEKTPFYKSKKGAQEAHEAIRPSSVTRQPEQIRSFLDDDEFKLYDLIWRKFLASQMTPALDEHIAVSIVAADKYFFKTTGRRNLFPGFSALYGETVSQKEGESEEEEKKDTKDVEEELFGELPELSEGEILKLNELVGNQHFTKPPARFNDASLVKTLEEEGIGRPSTYAPIIYTLVAREYATRKGGALIPTELGETVVDLLVEHFPNILDVQFTAGMEEELDRIEEGEKDWKAVLRNFYQPFSVTMIAAREQMKNFRQEVVTTDYKCETCGKTMVIRWGRFGKFMACSGFPECKTTRSIPTGVKCPEPNCGGDLVKRKAKNRRIFYGCSNYPKCNYITNKLPRADEGEEKESELGNPLDV